MNSELNVDRSIERILVSLPEISAEGHKNQVNILEELDEEETLMRAIAMSLEEHDVEEKELVKEELCSIRGELVKKATYQGS